MRLAIALPMSRAFSLHVFVALLLGFASSLPARADVVLERIKSSGRIVIAHRESSVLFSYLDADTDTVVMLSREDAGFMESRPAREPV